MQTFLEETITHPAVHAISRQPESFNTQQPRLKSVGMRDDHFRLFCRILFYNVFITINDLQKLSEFVNINNSTSG